MKLGKIGLESDGLAVGVDGGGGFAESETYEGEVAKSLSLIWRELESENELCFSVLEFSLSVVEGSEDGVVKGRLRVAGGGFFKESDGQIRLLSLCGDGAEEMESGSIVGESSIAVPQVGEEGDLAGAKAFSLLLLTTQANGCAFPGLKIETRGTRTLCKIKRTAV